jgi:hypothetical protein
MTSRTVVFRMEVFFKKDVSGGKKGCYLGLEGYGSVSGHEEVTSRSWD